jgi:predicted  nucleic acid-binding Zn-ribbon protein
VTTASPEHQRALLDVQAHASALNLLRRQRAEALEDPELLAARARAGSSRAGVEEAASAKSGADLAVQELEDKAEKIRSKIASNEQKLMSGQSGAATLQGLQREIESLTGSLAGLEDDEIAALDAAETAAESLSQAQSDSVAVQDALAVAEESVTVRVADIDRRVAEEQAAREQASEGIPADLLTDFEERLARYGIGVAKLTGSVSGGSGMELSPGDLAEIRKAPADEVVYCPDSGVILVRE